GECKTCSRMAVLPEPSLVGEARAQMRMPAYDESKSLPPWQRTEMLSECHRPNGVPNDALVGPGGVSTRVDDAPRKIRVLTGTQPTVEALGMFECVAAEQQVAAGIEAGVRWLRHGARPHTTDVCICRVRMYGPGDEGSATRGCVDQCGQPGRRRL